MNNNLYKKDTIKTNLLGEIFGKLRVIEKSENKSIKSGKNRLGEQKYSERSTWKCVCECGKEIIVLENNLLSKGSKSCGCTKRITGISIGNVFNKLTVISEGPLKYRPKTKGYEFTWKCECECGNTTIVTSHGLKKNKTKSCGCLVRDNYLGSCNNLPLGESALSGRINQIRKMAKQRNIAFHLTREECRILLQSPCYYCGKYPDIEYKSQAKFHDTGTLKLGGIDRYDPNGSYIYTNCVPCCRICNSGKWIQNPEDFFKWIQNLYINWFDENGILKTTPKFREIWYTETNE